MVIRSVVFLMLNLLTLSSVAANITVQVDRDPVSINESFKIIFEADDSVSDAPDFSPLQQEFEILNRSQSSNMQFINGSFTKQTRWTLYVMAKRSGTLQIPPIQVGNDTSPTITVTVNEQSSSGNTSTENEEMFIQVEATPMTAYVQSQILYTIRFYRAININGAGMSEPSFGGSEVVMQKLGDDSSFETQVNGRRYVVIERRYALFPQQSGPLTIEPIRLDVQVPVIARGVFDPFGQNSSTTRLTSKRLELDINPIPGTVQGNTWLPASQLQLTEKWSQDPPEFIVGEPITRTLTLKAEGLTAAQLPSLEMKDSDAHKAYPDQPRLNDKRGSRGISGTRQEKIAIIPTQPGPMTLPEIKIEWWNVNTNQLETITLPEHVVQVIPGSSPAPLVQPATLPQTNTPDLAPVPPSPESVVTATQESGRYAILSIVLGLGWLFTIIAWGVSHHRLNKQTSHPRGRAHTTPTRALPNSLKQACIGDNATQAKIELLNWGRTRWPADPPTNLSAIGQRLDEQTRQELEKLNTALYGSHKNTWQGSALWQAVSSAVKTHTTRPKENDSVLVPLYP